MLNHVAKLAISTVAVALVACGGGGGGSTSNVPTSPTNPVTPPRQTVDPNRIAGVVYDDAFTADPNKVVSVPASYQQAVASTYPPGSPQANAFDYINRERLRCGMGYIRQNTALDKASQGHTNYLTLNFDGEHVQTQGRPGFTGVSPNDRAIAAGYPTNPAPLVSESLNSGSIVFSGAAPNLSTLQDLGLHNLRMLMAAPYHLWPFVDPSNREIGLGWYATINNNAFGVPAYVNTIFVANPAKGQIRGPIAMAPVGSPVGKGDVYTWPCQGSTDVLPAFYGENPSPVSMNWIEGGVLTSDNRVEVARPLGSSIFVFMQPEYDEVTRSAVYPTLEITEASLTEVATSQAVALYPERNAKNDPVLRGQGFFPIKVFFPKQSLKAFTQYQARFKGTKNGQPFTKEFTYTTGSFCRVATGYDCADRDPNVAFSYENNPEQKP